MKRAVAVIALLGICVLGFSEGQKETSSETSSIAKEKMTFKVFATRSVPTGKFDIETNGFVKYYEDKTNIHIDWDLAIGDVNQQTQKLNLKLVSRDYPDILLWSPITRDQLALYGAQGVFIPLNKLIDTYAPNIQKAVADLPGLRETLTAPDGNIYGLPSLNLAYHVMYSQKMWINHQWLKNLGLTEPQTTDEFYRVLKAFKERDPNGNGEQDEIPLAAWGAMPAPGTTGTTTIFCFLINPFIYYDESFTMLKNGKVKFIVDHPEFKEAISYIRKLYSEGLILPEVFTTTRTQVTALSSSVPEIIGAATGLWPGMFLKGSDQYVKGSNFWDFDLALSPLKGPAGIRQTPAYNFQTVNNIAFAITKKCANPIAAVKWIDWLYSQEGTMIAHYGPEVADEAALQELKTGFRRALPGETGSDGNPAIWKYLQGNLDANANLFGSVFPMYQSTKMHTGQVTSTELSLERMLWEMTNKKMVPYAVAKSVPPLFISEENAAEFGELQSVLRTKAYEGMVQFILGVKDVDKDWPAYVSELKKLGSERFISIYQAEYDRNRAKR